MRNKRQIFLTCLLSVFLLVSCMGPNGSNKSKSEQAVPEVIPYKVISLEKNENREIDLDQIIVEDELGNTIEPRKIEQSEDSIKIYPPKNGYVIGETYKVTSSKNLELQKEFKVRDFKEDESRLKNLIDWGIGFELQKDVQNDRDYEWYIDQMKTGKHSNSNCGPASVTMAIKWVDEKFDKTAADARKVYREDGGWWYTDDIFNYLKNNDVNFRVRPEINEEKMVDELNKGNIFLLCMNTKYITRNRNQNQRIGRFYNYSNGHFIIVKGYVKMDDNIFFTVYDPNNWDMKNDDLTSKGKNRFYKSKELVKSVVQWWNNYFIIYNEKTAAE